MLLIGRDLNADLEVFKVYLFWSVNKLGLHLSEKMKAKLKTRGRNYSLKLG